MMAWTSLAMMPAAARECSPATAAPNATTAEISSILSNTQNFYQLNAIIFSAEQNGMPILRTALGISTDGLPARTDMHFRIGAVGWQYLTTLLLKMVDQQGIALRDPVSRWFRSYPNADRATVRMLAASSMPTVRRFACSLRRARALATTSMDRGFSRKSPRIPFAGGPPTN